MLAGDLHYLMCSQDLFRHKRTYARVIKDLGPKEVTAAGARGTLPIQNNRCLHNAQMLEPARAKVVTHLVYVLIVRRVSPLLRIVPDIMQ